MNILQVPSTAENTQSKSLRSADGPYKNKGTQFPKRKTKINRGNKNTETNKKEAT